MNAALQHYTALADAAAQGKAFDAIRAAIAAEQAAAATRDNVDDREGDRLEMEAMVAAAEMRFALAGAGIDHKMLRDLL